MSGEIGKIIHNIFYGDKKSRNEELAKHTIVLCEIDENDNNSYNVSRSDSLYLITIDGRDYLVDIPWNRFYPYNDCIPDGVLNWYEF